MARPTDSVRVYLELGSKRTFAGSIDWPGWCRSGRDEASALAALAEYGKRYARILRTAGLGFQAPDVAAFSVVERLKGDATTDFGAPAMTPSSDARPITEDELRRMQAILRACWRGFDKAVEAAEGKELRKGPRGGGRDLRQIIRHVTEADIAYLGRLGWKYEPGDDEGSAQEVARVRRSILSALGSYAPTDKPAKGPRGGVRWWPRYFVRRVAWHALDHAWEIEDRFI